MPYLQGSLIFARLEVSLDRSTEGLDLDWRGCIYDPNAVRLPWVRHIGESLNRVLPCRASWPVANTKRSVSPLLGTFCGLIGPISWTQIVIWHGYDQLVCIGFVLESGGRFSLLTIMLSRPSSVLNLLIHQKAKKLALPSLVCTSFGAVKIRYKYSK